MNTHTENLWQDYSLQLKRFIRQRVSDELTADDLLQEVFVRVHTHIDSLQDDTRLTSWLYRITRNVIVDHYRAGKPVEELTETLVWAEEGEADAAQSLLPCLRGMVDSLPEPYRDALRLTELHGLTQQELARHQGLSVSGAKSRVQRARAKLKKSLLACCHFEFDRRGNLLDYQRHSDRCSGCAQQASAIT